MEKEEVFTVHVAINGSVEMKNVEGNSVVMISFTGHASGPYFEGRVLEGGVDTQIIGPSGTPHTLSARYMLRGTDRAGQPCEIYIENNGEIDKRLETEGILFRTSPKLETNSAELSFLNKENLVGEGRPSEDGVEIKIYRLES